MTGKISKKLLFGIFIDGSENWSWEIFCTDHSVGSMLEIVRTINVAASQIIAATQKAEDELSINVNITGTSESEEDMGVAS